MKTNWQTKKLEDEKKPFQPSWKDSEFAKTTHGQIMMMVNKAIETGHLIEAQALLWSVIEQILLPKLIGLIAKDLKINLPKAIYKINAQNTNLLYFCISHDEELYKKLENGRIMRNKMIHNLASLVDGKTLKKEAKESLILYMSIQDEIVKRFTGEVLISSTNLYRSGWNDHRKNLLDNLRKKGLL